MAKVGAATRPLLGKIMVVLPDAHVEYGSSSTTEHPLLSVSRVL